MRERRFRGTIQFVVDSRTNEAYDAYYGLMNFRGSREITRIKKATCIENFTIENVSRSNESDDPDIYYDVNTTITVDFRARTKNFRHVSTNLRALGKLIADHYNIELKSTKVITNNNIENELSEIEKTEKENIRQYEEAMREATIL